MKPETVIGWHRQGFRLFWTWRVRHGQPSVARETRDLIRRMCREKPSGGVPRIHGELLKLGIDIGETSVIKYMVQCRNPPVVRCFLAKRNSLGAWACENVYWEVVALVAGIDLEHLLGAAMLALREFRKFIAMGDYPEMIKKRIEYDASGGWRDRDAFDK